MWFVISKFHNLLGTRVHVHDKFSPLIKSVQLYFMLKGCVNTEVAYIRIQPNDRSDSNKTAHSIDGNGKVN